MDRLEFEAGLNEIGRMLDGGIDQDRRGQLAGNSPRAASTVDGFS
jgi:hypothetical protein